MLFADLALARRLEDEEAAQHQDYVEALRRMVPEISYAELAVAGGHAFFAGSTSLFSRALGLRLHGPVTRGALFVPRVT
jgi:Ethanolamine utilization protein EutJ (predicted chaperonin)